MWNYSEKVMDHYRNPRNVGQIENPSAVGQTGNISCGDSLTLYLKIDENGIITDAKFQTFGCGSAVASSSILTEMIIGKTVEEAQKITNKDIAEELGGLPAQKLHCSVMGKEALDDALASYTGVKIEEEDRVICKCFDVKESHLRHVIKENNLDTIEKIQNYTKACSGCQHCREDIEKIMVEELGLTGEAVPKKEEVPLTKTQMILKVNKVLENDIAEELRKDGGDIELVDVDNHKVYVKLQGCCKTCPSSTLTLKNFVEKVLQEHISKDIEVEQVE
jgi:NifU-like protein